MLCIYVALYMLCWAQALVSYVMLKLTSCHVFCILKLYRSYNSSKEQIGMVSPLSDSLVIPPSLFAAYNVRQVQSRVLPVRIMNTSHVNIELHAGQNISEFCPIIDVSDQSEFIASATVLPSPLENQHC